jgi:hypothetical protein
MFFVFIREKSGSGVFGDAVYLPSPHNMISHNIVGVRDACHPGQGWVTFYAWAVFVAYYCAYGCYAYFILFEMSLFAIKNVYAGKRVFLP